MNEMPPIIYNYMSIERFEKLLNTGEWQLSNPIYSNDPKERALELIGKMNDVKEIPAFSCFCDNPYNPTMWHFYGGKYAGVCLGFDTEMMAQVFGSSIQIHQMEYPTFQEQAQRNVGKPKESLIDKLKYKNTEWMSEREIRVFFELEECQKKLYPNYPNDRYIRERFLFGMLRLVTQVYLGEKCIIRHFLQTLIEGKKALSKRGIETSDSYKMLHPDCVLFSTKSLLNGKIVSTPRCPQKLHTPKQGNE